MLISFLSNLDKIYEWEKREVGILIEIDEYHWVFEVAPRHFDSRNATPLKEGNWYCVILLWLWWFGGGLWCSVERGSFGSSSRFFGHPWSRVWFCLPLVFCSSRLLLAWLGGVWREGLHQTMRSFSRFRERILWPLLLLFCIGKMAGRFSLVLAKLLLKFQSLNWRDWLRWWWWSCCIVLSPVWNGRSLWKRWHICSKIFAHEVSRSIYRRR